MLGRYDGWVKKALDRPKEVVCGFAGVFVLSFALYPLVGVSFFPRTDAGQFVINVKAPTGTRIEVTEDYVKKVENIVRQIVRPDDLNAVVSNIGLTPDLSSLSTPNSGDAHRLRRSRLEGGSPNRQLRLHGRSPKAVAKQLPELRTYFQSGGLVDSVFNQGMPAPIDVQVSGNDLQAADRDRS